MRRNHIIRLVGMLACGLVVLVAMGLATEQVPMQQLEAIVADIPEDWHEGGWDKEAELKALMAQYPTNVALCARCQYYIASQHYANRDHQRAIQEYQTLIAAYPPSWLECQKAQFEIGQIYLYRLDNPQQAISEYERTIHDYPRSFVRALAQLGLGRAYRRLGEVEQAKQAYQMLVTDLSEYAHEVTEAYLDLGHLSIAQALTPGAASSTRDVALRQAISAYNQAYLACPLEATDLMTQCLDSLHRAFRTLDGNFVRANAFVRYQRYGAAGEDGRLGTSDDLADHLQEEF